MGGFISDGTRDVIALIGLVLAILQTALAFKALSAATADESLGRGQVRKRLRSLLLDTLLSPKYGQFIREALVKFIGCLCAVGATMWLLKYVTPPPSFRKPVSLIQTILFFGSLFAAAVVPIYFMALTENIEESLKENDASETQIRKLRAIFLSLVAVVLSLCLLALWFGDANGWARIFLQFQFIGWAVLVLAPLSGVIEPGLK